MTALAYISHALPGRVRIKVPDRRGDTDFFSRIEDRLGGIDGIAKLQTNPLTGSILIEHHTAPLDRVFEAAQREALFTLQAPDDPGEPPPEAASLDESPLALWISQRGMGGLGFDINSALALLMLALAVRQMMRGQVMVPALSLLWYAYELVQRESQPTEAPAADPALHALFNDL